MFLNDRPVIVDRMPPATEEDAFGFKSIPLVATEERTGVHRQDSPKMELIAGEKYRIRIELVHSSHLKYKNPDTAVLRQVGLVAPDGWWMPQEDLIPNRLLWRSDAAESDVIPEKHFFTSNAAPTAKFSG